MKEQLIRLGLNENEAKIYLAALGMGTFSAGNMAAHAKIKRPTTYLTLENLLKLGLVKVRYVNKKKLFQAQPPAVLEKLTKRMRRKVIEAEILAEELIPALAKIPPAALEEPELSYHEGIASIKNILLDVSASSKPWHLFGLGWPIIKKLSLKDLVEILEEGSKARHRAGLPKVRFISDTGILNLPPFKTKTASREQKFLKKPLASASMLLLYEDKLAILNFSQTFAIVIKSTEVTALVLNMYNLIWDSL